MWALCGRGAGAVEAQRNKGHTSLKFEKDGSLAKRASGAPKSIADKRCDYRRKVGRENRKNAPRLAPEVSAWE